MRRLRDHPSSGQPCDWRAAELRSTSRRPTEGRRPLQRAGRGVRERPARRSVSLARCSISTRPSWPRRSTIPSARSLSSSAFVCERECAIWRLSAAAWKSPSTTARARRRSNIELLLKSSASLRTSRGEIGMEGVCSVKPNTSATLGSRLCPPLSATRPSWPPRPSAISAAASWASGTSPTSSTPSAPPPIWSSDGAPETLSGEVTVASNL